MRGPKVKPESEKKVKGTARKHRRLPEPPIEPVTKLIASEWLPEDAKAAWESIRPQLEGMVTAAELPMLEVYCCLLGRFHTGEKEGKPMRSPEVAQMRGLAASFGLLPAERARVPKKKAPKKPTGFEGMG